MNYPEDDLLPISALQHLLFCERQWGLIHLEGQWAENVLTAEGRILHEKAHESRAETRAGVRTVRGLRLRSLALGLTGVADVVEFHLADDGAVEGVALPGVRGRWLVFPVEYKRGRPKPDHCDHVQLCAQALCLEEMLETGIPAGAVFYGQPRRRQEVPFTPDLRAETWQAAERLHELTRTGRTPEADYGRKCRACSLVHACLPRMSGARRASSYLTEIFQDDGKEPPES